MRIYLDCIPCFIRQSLDAARHATEDIHIHEKVVRGVLGLANNLDMSQSPPVIGQKIHSLSGNWWELMTLIMALNSGLIMQP